MPRICSSAIPPEDGGPMLQTIVYRYSPHTGARSITRYPARSSSVMEPGPPGRGSVVTASTMFRATGPL
jgi:hypothetical protein